jgi:hypothetical protein
MKSSIKLLEKQDNNPAIQFISNHYSSQFLLPVFTFTSQSQPILSFRFQEKSKNG